MLQLVEIAQTIQKDGLGIKKKPGCQGSRAFGFRDFRIAG